MVGRRVLIVLWVIESFSSDLCRHHFSKDSHLKFFDEHEVFEDVHSIDNRAEPETNRDGNISVPCSLHFVHGQITGELCKTC